MYIDGLLMVACFRRTTHATDASPRLVYRHSAAAPEASTEVRDSMDHCCGRAALGLPAAGNRGGNMVGSHLFGPRQVLQASRSRECGRYGRFGRHGGPELPRG